MQPFYNFGHFMRIQQFLLVMMLFSLVGCTTIEDCQNDPNRSYMIIQFAHNEIVSFDSIRFNNLYRLDADTDTLSTLGVFLDPQLARVDLDFFTDSVDYQLSVSYNAQLQIFELDCNPTLKISNLDTIGHSFDSLVINQTVLTNSNFNGDVTVYF
ncbi:MAG: hypothetical protein ACO2ZZ_00540 [Cyclobacteriaceae bacterium]